jgi:hypothetical protein
MSEKPGHSRLRRMVDWINLTGAKKVHSLNSRAPAHANAPNFMRGARGIDWQARMVPALIPGRHCYTIKATV